jgi:hypothetical protein
VSITALGSWGRLVPRGHSLVVEKETRRVVYGVNHRARQLGETGPPRPFRTLERRRPERVVYDANHRAGQLGKICPPGNPTYTPCER